MQTCYHGAVVLIFNNQLEKVPFLKLQLIGSLIGHRIDYYWVGGS